MKAIELLNASPGSHTPLHMGLLRDATAISLLSLVPPDRVGLIRKLRLGHTLKRREGGWRLDLTKARDGHKTSRFYGPFAAALPDALNGVLNAYAAVLELEVGGGDAYLFHPIRSGAIDRPVESSAWTAYVKSLFTRLVGTGVAPKTLRSIFITWLRSAPLPTPMPTSSPLFSTQAYHPHPPVCLTGRIRTAPRSSRARRTQ